MKSVNKIIFILILLFATILRFWHLSTLPSSLNWDEISHGYNAYSLLQTGKDQWGQSWPLFTFRAYGDYPTAGNLYATMPFVALLGLNALSIRLPAAIFGLLFVICAFIFARIIFKSTSTALITMFITAVSPWVLFPSRGVFQSNLSQLFLLAGTLFFFYGLKKPRGLVLSFLFLSISTYTYHNARIIAPLILLTLTIFYYRQLLGIFRSRPLIFYFSTAIILLILLPNVINLFSPSSMARNRWVGIINPNSINLINESRRVFSGPHYLNILVNNKAVYFVRTLSLNYLELFNPLPLFFRGSQNYQFNPPSTGLIFSVFLPFFYIGLIIFLKRIFVDSKALLIVLLMLISLLPAALTAGDFPSIRATSSSIYYFLFISYGLVAARPILRRLGFILIISISLFQLSGYIRTYLRYDTAYSQAWQYGYQQAVDYIKDNYSDYNQIVFTKKYGEPHEFVLFYTPVSPQKFQNDPNLKWDFHADWYWVDAFDKYVFKNDWDIKSYSFKPGTLLVTSPDNYPPSGFTRLKTLNFKDGSPAFEILKND